MPPVKSGMSSLEIFQRQFLRMEFMTKATSQVQVLDAIMIFALEALADQSHIFGARNTRNFSSLLREHISILRRKESRSTYGQNTALVLECLEITVRMHLWRIGVKSSNEFPLLDWSKISLAFHNNDLMCPDGVTESFDIGIFS